MLFWHWVGRVCRSVGRLVVVVVGCDGGGGGRFIQRLLADRPHLSSDEGSAGSLSVTLNPTAREAISALGEWAESIDIAIPSHTSMYNRPHLAF